MKRVIIFLLGLVLTPCIVYADMGSPMLYEYNIEVNNVNGASCYEYSYNSEEGKGIYTKVATIPYKATSKVILETNLNGKAAGEVEYNGIKGWVYVLNGAVGIKEEKKIKAFEDIKVYSDSSCNNEINVIAKGTVIDSYYTLDPWSSLANQIYISYNGWIRSPVYFSNSGDQAVFTYIEDTEEIKQEEPNKE